MRSSTVVLSLCLLVAASGAHADQEDDLLRAASWCATAARIASGWQAHSLPRPYARRTLTIAVDALQDLDRTFADRNDDVGRARLARAIDAVRRTRDAVEQQDTGSIPARVDELSQQSRSLASTR